MNGDRTALLGAWTDERAAAASARRQGDLPEEWRHLERAHILSQPMVGPHVRTHVVMLATAARLVAPNLVLKLERDNQEGGVS